MNKGYVAHDFLKTIHLKKTTKLKYFAGNVNKHGSVMQTTHFPGFGDTCVFSLTK